jgi:hypothetical protein
MSDTTLVNKAMKMTFICDVTTARFLRDLVAALELGGLSVDPLVKARSGR